MADIKPPLLFYHYPDLKVEFILGELLESGLDPEDVVINALGIFKRRYGKDIVGGEMREYKTNKRQYLKLDINRNGIYDLLPKGLFHQPQNRKNNITASQAIEEYNNVLSLEPDNLVALFNLGVIYKDKGDYMKAGKQWQRILAVKPDDVDAKKALLSLENKKQ